MIQEQRADKRRTDIILESGFAKEKAEGELKGKVEAKMEIATTMKQNGMDIPSISACTGLTVEEIETL